MHPNTIADGLDMMTNTPLMTLHDVSFVITDRLGQSKPKKSWLQFCRSERKQDQMSVGSHGAFNFHATSSDNSSSSVSTQARNTNEINSHNPTHKTLLKSINLKVHTNEKISVIGPNGAGKSTLMKLMLGLLKPSSGYITRDASLNIGYVPQKFNIPAILPLRVCDFLNQTKSQLTKAQKSRLYERLSIEPLLKQQMIHLSGGENQRVLLARSLLGKPNLLILDEPMQGLDPESERWLYEFIDDLPDFLQCSMVVVSHDLHWVMQGSRRVICLNKHICCEGQPSDLGISPEFKQLFGHQYEQPYIHKPHHCQHQCI